MVLFETRYVFGVENGDVYVRTGDVTPYESHIADDSIDMWRDICVQGLQKNDFALFADVTDAEGTMDIPYLVSHYFGDTSIIVPAALIDFDTRQYATPELARKLQSVEPSELAQFGIDSLVKELTRRYPVKSK